MKPPARIEPRQRLVVGGLVLVTLLGCAGSGSQRSQSVRYVDPGGQGEIATTGIESQDIGAAAKKAAQSIVDIPEIAQATRPPTILLQPVVNRSATPIDVDLYTTKLRGMLMQNATGKARFLARAISAKTNDAEQALREEGIVRDRGTAQWGRQAESYDYILTAVLQGIATTLRSGGQSDYFLVSFQMVDFNDVLVWESQYEIKKEGYESAVYR